AGRCHPLQLSLSSSSSSSFSSSSSTNPLHQLFSSLRFSSLLFTNSLTSQLHKSVEVSLCSLTPKEEERLRSISQASPKHLPSLSDERGLSSSDEDSSDHGVWF
ncbi:hypothetical protein M758_7G127300, partial [Ceratodon purpureus]